MRRYVAGVIAACGLALVLASPAAAISRARADAIALQTLGTRSDVGMVALFGGTAPVPAGDTVSAWSMGTARTMPSVRLAAPAWVFWEDLVYGADLSHPSELLVVDDHSGRVLAHMDLDMMPLVNGAELPFDPGNGAYSSTKYLVYSTVPIESAATTSARAAASRRPGDGPSAGAAQNGPITAADMKRECMITFGDRGKREGNNRGDGRFKKDFAAMDAWAKTVGITPEDVMTPTVKALKDTIYKVVKAGCRDVLIYVAGHGKAPDASAVENVPIHFGDFAPPAADVHTFSQPGIQLTANVPAGAPADTAPVQTFVDPADIASLITTFSEPGEITIDGKEEKLTADEVKGLQFKLKLQSCFSGWFASSLLATLNITPGEAKATPLALVESSSSATEFSFFHIPNADVLGPDGKIVVKKNETSNPQGISEATNANVYGLTAWAKNPTMGRTLLAGLQQAFTLGAGQDFSRVIGYTHPQIMGPGFQTLGTPDPTTATTTLTSHAIPMRQGAGTSPSYTCSGAELPLFDDTNGDEVGNGGTAPTFSTGGKSYCIESISTYHWNGGFGAPPGTIGLRDSSGSELGPWTATGSAGQATETYPAGVPDANWTVTPGTPTAPVVIDGTYTCKDSDPATWSQDAASGGRGFCKVWVQDAEPAE